MRKSGDTELAAVIGEEAYVGLAEAYGGTRLYIPRDLPRDHAIVEAVGLEAARRLIARYSPDCIKVPLARDERAQRYRAGGDSNAQIARKLGITEGGVERMFKRMAVAD